MKNYLGTRRFRKNSKISNSKKSRRFNKNKNPNKKKTKTWMTS